jgi:thiaminase
MFLQVLIIAVIGTSVLADPLVRDAVINRLNTYDVLNIPFFKGIIEGDLSPYCYTRLLIQDSYYLDSNTLLWDVTRKMAQNDP